MSNTSKLGWILLSGASLAAMGAFSPALAQDNEVSDEIVVTATGRSAAIQDVPLAVTAIGGEQLQNSGVQDLRDVTQVAPSFSMGTGQSNSSGTIARIRGIGTGSDNPGFEAAVGIFIDGVYRARAGAALADLPDLQRVEVLRGPQGTLFGRNTSAGAISVITQGPEFTPGMYIEGLLGADDLGETGMRAGVNVPLSDSFAIRIDGSVRARDGYITDVVSGDDINNRNRWSSRGQLQWDLSPTASLRVIVDGAKTDEVCCGITPLIYGSSQAVLNGIAGSLGLPSPSVPLDPDSRNMTVTPAYPGLPALGPGLPAQPATAARTYGEKTDDFGVSGQLDWEIGGMNFTSISSYRDWSALRDQDIDFSSVDIAYRDGLAVGFETYTQEFRLQGENGPLNWLVGVFYGNEKLNTTDTIRIGAHANLYSNIITQANTAGLGGPFELYDSTAGDTDGVDDPIPSLFWALSGGAVPLYLTGNTAGQGQNNDHWNIDTESLSVFTHDEYSLSENLVLTVGVRYNHETKDLTGDIASTSTSCDTLRTIETVSGGLVTGILASPASSLMNLACNPAINPISNSSLQPGGLWSGSNTENEWSGTTSLAYHINEDVMVYGGYSRGYKAGGYNVDRSGFSVTPATTDPTTLSVDQLAFNPEFTDAYEMGLKSTILGGSTTLNLAAFYQQIHDYQLNSFNGFNFITRNVPEAISQGIELELASRPTDNLTLSGGVVYNDAFYDTTVDFNLPGVADPFGRNIVTSGTPFTFAPKWTVTGGIAYEMPLGGSMRALFYLDGRWNDGYRTQTLSREPNGATDNDAFAIFNGRVGIGPQNGRWSLELWGRNLFDEHYIVGAFVPPLQDSSSSPSFANYVIYPNEPQTYGVTMRARY
jgi:iron complex outermembrane recepter protein